jgi:hypothetical protein
MRAIHDLSSSEVVVPQGDPDARLEHDWLRVFGTSPLDILGHGRRTLRFFVVRCLLAAVMITILALSVGADVVVGCGWSWPLYFTHLMLLLQCAYLVLGAAAAWRAWSSKSLRAKSMPLWVHAMWWLQDIQLVGTFIVVLGYWTMVHTSIHKPWRWAWTTHGVNLIVSMVDLAISSEPLTMRHAVLIGILGVMYLALTVVFWAVDGTNCKGEHWIYKALDYRDGRMWVGSICMVFIAMGMYSVLSLANRASSFPLASI